jgi:outer membrane protein OmpA-like peptidoglycan-associated protein
MGMRSIILSIMFSFLLVTPESSTWAEERGLRPTEFIDMLKPPSRNPSLPNTIRTSRERDEVSRPRTKKILPSIYSSDSPDEIFSPNFNRQNVVVTGPKSLISAPTISISVIFSFNSARLSKIAEKSLNSLGEALSSNELSTYKFEISGHTDSVGNDQYNFRLSKRRAETVRRHLISVHKIDPNRLVAKGYGETKLLKPEQPKSSENRRVQVTNIGQFE